MPLLDRVRRFRALFLSTFLNQSFIFGLQFIGSILVVRALSIEDYAAYVLINTTLNLASSLANMGLRSYLTVFVPGADRDKARRILWAVLAGQLLASAALLLAYLPALPNPEWNGLGKFTVAHPGFIFACVAATYLLSFIPRQFAGTFRYLEDHKRANRLQAISGAAFPVFLIGSFLALGDFTLGWLLGGMALVQVVCMAFVIPMSGDLAAYPGTAALAGELKAAMRYSWPFAFLPVATQIIELGNRYFLAGYGTAVDLAQFSFNYGICNAAFQLINTTMGHAFFPRALRMFNHGQRMEAERLNLKGVIASFALVAFAFAAFWAVSPIFFGLLGKESLRLPALPFLLICASFLAQVLGNQANFVLQAYNLRFSNVGTVIAGTVISLALNALLVPRWQATGAACALAASALALLLLNLVPTYLLRKKATT